MTEISVIIPTYNREKLIKRAIDSVLNQTFEDFELIIVDDASTDDTIKIIENYSDKRIKLLPQIVNKGANAARNEGIQSSKGKYIAFLDSDDEWLPSKLEKQWNLFNSSNLRNLGAVGCGRKLIIEKDGKIESKEKMPQNIYGDIYNDFLKGRVLPTTSRWPGGTPMIMIKSECFQKVGYFDTELSSAQDHDLYIRLSKYYQFDVVSEVLVNVYIHTEGRISSSIDAQISGKDDFLKKYDKDIPFFSYLRSMYSHIIGLQYLKSGEPLLARKYLFKSILADPLKAKYYYHFILSYL